MMETRIIPPRNKLMLVASFSSILWLAVFVTFKFHVLNIGGEWADSQVFDDVLMIWALTYWLVLCIGSTYYAWTLNSDDFWEWLRK